MDISGEYGWGLCRKSVGNVSTDTVYNIGVEEDESYIADGVIVHNCQDLSVAGRGEGLAGKRSGLFYEIVRLAKEIKPKFLFLENVPAIRTRGLGTVLEELTKAGYDSRWCMLSASEVGAPHKRERWFLLACKSERPATNANSERLEGQRHISSGVKEKHPFIVEHGGWEVEPNLDRVAHGISYWVDKLAECIDDPECEQETLVSVAKSAIEAATINERIKRLGNAVVPLQAKTSFEILLGLRRNS